METLFTSPPLRHFWTKVPPTFHIIVFTAFGSVFISLIPTRSAEHSINLYDDYAVFKKEENKFIVVKLQRMWKKGSRGYVEYRNPVKLTSLEKVKVLLDALAVCSEMAISGSPLKHHSCKSFAWFGLQDSSVMANFYPMESHNVPNTQYLWELTILSSCRSESLV